MRVSSADWFKAGVARQRAGPTSIGIAPRACAILNKLLLLLLLLSGCAGGRIVRGTPTLTPPTTEAYAKPKPTPPGTTARPRTVFAPLPKHPLQAKSPQKNTSLSLSEPR